ncbi:hypothetical protein XANCAGTX0491_010043 [Xanthoria calcicola]
MDILPVSPILCTIIHGVTTLFRHRGQTTSGTPKASASLASTSPTFCPFETCIKSGVSSMTIRAFLGVHQHSLESREGRKKSG